MIATLLVFGLAALMVIRGYDPVIIAGVVTATSIAASELAHRIRGTNRSDDGIEETSS